MYVKYLNIHKCSENDTPIKKLYILNSFKKCFSQIEGKIPYPPPPPHPHTQDDKTDYPELNII